MAQVTSDLMALSYFCYLRHLHGQFWLPAILKADGISSTMEIGYYSAIPYIVAAVAMFLIGKRSDRLRERRYHSALPAILGAAALAMARPQRRSPASFADFHADRDSRYLERLHRFLGHSLRTSAGQCGSFGGFVSPTIIGRVHTQTGSIKAGLYVMVAITLLGAILLFVNHASPSRLSQVELANQGHYQRLRSPRAADISIPGRKQRSTRREH